MKTFCKCGDAISKKAQAEADQLDADYPRCDGCLQIWKESPAIYKKIGGKKRMPKSNLTEELLEQYASEGLSTKEAAERFKMTFASFRQSLYDKKRPWIKEAWERGQTNGNGATTPTPAAPEAKVDPPNTNSFFATNDALTQCFYLLLRDYLPAGRLHKVIEEVRAADGKGKRLSIFHLASLAEEYAGIIQKTK
jgi:hypothetical protein